MHNFGLTLGLESVLGQYNTVLYASASCCYISG